MAVAKKYLWMLLFQIPIIVAIPSCSKEEQVSKPNIIFILADDLGYGDLGCYGQQIIKTPNIDNLAYDGMRFTQYYAGSPVCSPSRSVLMTGQHTGHTTVRGNKCKVGGTVGYKRDREVRRMNLLDDDVTVAQVLRNAGYKTCLVGKWHLGGYNPDAGPLNRGFDEFYGGLSRTFNYHQPPYWPPNWFNNDELVDIPENQNGQMGYYRTDINTDNAINFIERNRKNPFLLYLSFSIPHSPFDAPDFGPYVNKEWPNEEKTYAAMIHHLDLSVGRVMESLERLNLDEKTIVFFSSDNGPRSEGTDLQTRVINFFNSNGNLRGYKRDLYEGGIRVPMIVRWPGKISKSKTNDAVCYFADFLPTAADLASTKPPDNIDGISMWPSLINNSNEMNDRFLYWEYFGRGFQQAVRWKNWKAIRFKPEEPLLLFDLSQDLYEENNVANKHSEIIEQIEDYLQTARTESPNWPLEKLH
ncbi:MAG: arylsulfatase [Ignavibacterium sp.]|nr:MAG: arylsulfatase [Ignavibacterium sp.]